MSTQRIWIVGCSLVMVAAVALGWLLGASPLLQAARTAGEAREAVQAQNLTYSQELAALKEQFTGIGELEDELSELREELPPRADQPEYLAQLVTSAQRHSVRLTAITVADAVAYAPTAAEVPAAETPAADAETPDTADAEVATGPDENGAGVPVTSPLVTAENFVSIPVTLAVEGDYGNVLDFVESVQTGTRLSAVTAFSTSEDAAPAAGAEEGEPAGTAIVTGTVTVIIYALLDPAAG